MLVLLAAAAIDPSIASKYRAGYGECANEIIRFLATTPNADAELKTKLISHLSSRIQNLSSVSILPPHPATLSPTLAPMNFMNKTDRYSVNSSTNNQYIFILPSQDQPQMQPSQTPLTFTSRVSPAEDDGECSSTSSNPSSDCESLHSEESPSSTSIESPSKVWRPWWWRWKRT